MFSAPSMLEDLEPPQQETFDALKANELNPEDTYTTIDNASFKRSARVENNKNLLKSFM